MITNENVFLMWTKSSIDSLGFNHFVPLSQRDRKIEFMESNVDQMLGKKSKMHERTVSHIDLTGNKGNGRYKGVDCDNEELVHLKCKDNGTVCVTSVADCENGKNIDNSSVDNSQEDGNLCKTNCIMNDKSKCFSEKNQGILDIESAPNQRDGYEDTSLNYHEAQEILCTCCHRNCMIKNRFLFTEYSYDFGNEVVSEALSDEICQYSSDGIEYIRKSCDMNLHTTSDSTPKCPNFPLQIHLSYRKKHPYAHVVINA